MTDSPLLVAYDSDSDSDLSLGADGLFDMDTFDDEDSQSSSSEYSTLSWFSKHHPLRRPGLITDPILLGIECHPDLEPSDIERLTFDILNKYLQPSSCTSPTDAAWQLHNGLPFNRPHVDGEESPECLLEEFWDLMLRLAQQIPHNHPSQERFVQFIIALSDLPVDTKVLIGKDTSHLWHDLPMLGFGMESWMNRIPIGDILIDDNTRQRWHSYNSFVARLLRDGVYAGLHSAALSCVSVLSSALEDEPDPRSKAYKNYGPELDVFVPIAADWILLAAKEVYSLSLANYSVGFYGNRGKNFKGPVGFSAPRWDFWKGRFETISNHHNVKDETKLLAKRALEAMHTTEQSSTSGDFTCAVIPKSFTPSLVSTLC